MACLLQPECNFLYSFFRCKLPVGVVDVEVKITSMQQTHIFRRQDNPADQLYPLEHEASSASHYHKENEDLSRGGGKMGPIPIPVPDNQFRPPLPDTNANVRKDNVTEKRKRAMPKKKFRPATPKPTTVCPPLPEAPPKPRIPCPYIQYQQEKTSHGQVQEKCQETFLRTEIGYSLKLFGH